MPRFEIFYITSCPPASPPRLFLTAKLILKILAEFVSYRGARSSTWYIVPGTWYRYQVQEEPGFRRMPIIRKREFLIKHLIKHFF